MKKKLTLYAPLIVLILIIAVYFITQKVASTQKADSIDSAIKLGGEWFLNNQNENFLFYEYNIESKSYTGDQHPLREMGSLWAVTILNDYTKDKRFEELEQRGFAYFERYFQPISNESEEYIIVNITPGDTKIGYSAFIILALINIEHEKKDEYLQKLGKGLVLIQQADGSLKTYFDSEQTSGVDYYPGESLFALMSLYEYTKDEEYLKSVVRAFPYYRDYWRGNKNAAFVPWQSRAYEKLYKANKSKEVADFVLEMNDYMLEQYTPTKNCSGFVFSKGIVTAVHLEGVHKAYLLAKKLRDKKRAECYANFIIEGINATLTLQVPNSSQTNPEAMGGFRGSAESDTLRVDRNQHAVMVLIESRNSGII